MLMVFAGKTEICGCTPAPESEIVAGEFVALLTTDTLPTTLPAAAGTKPTFNEALCPAARLSGNERPPALKPAPVTFTCEMVTAVLPEFIRATVCAVLGLPTNTFPKLKLLVLVESRYVWIGGAWGAMPVPDSGTVITPPDVRLSAKDRFPEKLFAESGR